MLTSTLRTKLLIAAATAVIAVTTWLAYSGKWDQAKLSWRHNKTQSEKSQAKGSPDEIAKAVESFGSFTTQQKRPNQIDATAKERREEELREDQPGEAIEFFLQKRLPAGETSFAATRYLQAIEQITDMPVFSSAENRFIANGEKELHALQPESLPSWTPLGPGNVGGRTRALLIHPSTPNTMYAAGVSGGVWKTTDGGANWSPLTDLLANIAVNSMAMDPTNPNVIYAGTGEGFNNLDAVRGAGIFKTTDGGATWNLLTATTNNANFYYVNDLVISPLNSQRLYAATSRGVFRSSDGGLNWVAVHQPTNGSTLIGCQDLAIRTTGISSDYVLAACGNFTQASIFLKTDAENSGGWSPVKAETGMGRTSLAIAPSNQNIVYALSSELSTNVGGFNYQNGLHAVFRSIDGGQTWTTQRANTGTPNLNTMVMSYISNNCSPGNTNFTGQGWYDNVIAVDPADANRVWVGGIDLFRSDDGGVNWGFGGNNVHTDQHTIVFHPGYDGSGNQTMFVSNDGGLFKTINARATVGTMTPVPGNCTTGASAVNWTNLNNGYEATQFYHGAPYPNGASYFGGTQDNGTIRGTDANGRNGWAAIRGGDGGYVAVDPANTNVLFAENTFLSLGKTTNGDTVSPTWTSATNGITESSGNFLFIAPFTMDASNSQRLWIGGRTIWRTTDGAASWTQASITDQLSPGRVSALAVAPTDSNSVIVGSSTGGIFRNASALSATAGTAWANSSPRTGYVSWVAFDPNSANVVYATYSTFGGTHVWKSFDGGASWTGIDGTGAAGLPDVPVHCLAVHPNDSARLYVGTDIGVFVSLDGGASWARENTGFANVVTESLTILGSGCNATLYAFTHGRGVWKVPAADCAGCHTIGGFSPASGAVGSSVTINGTNLTGVTVRFSGNPAAATITGNTGTVLTVTVPASAVTGPITISKPNCLDVQTANFIVPGTPGCPMAVSLGQASGAVGSLITISGPDLTGVNQVTFSNNVSAGFTVLSNTQLSATVPGGAVSGAITISKTGCGPTQTTSFTVTAAACPTISGVTPASGNIGSEVIITGTNLTGVGEVRFGNAIAQFFTNNDSQITAYVPNGLAPGGVTLSVVRANCTTQTTNFTVLAGGAWTNTAGPTGGHVNSLLVAGGNLFATTLNGRVYRSADNGLNWTASSMGLPATAQTYSLGVNGATLFVGTNYGAYRSTDNGANWAAVNNGMSTFENGLEYTRGVLALATIGSTVFAATSDYGVYRTTDNGANWTQVINGLGNQTVLSLAVSGTTLFAGTYSNGVYRSNDNGSNWLQVNNGLGNQYAIYALAVGGSNVFAGTSGNGVYRSSDNGVNWEQFGNGLGANQAIRALAISGANLYASTAGSGVYLSTNNAVSWTAANNGLGNTYLLSLAASGANVFAGGVRGFFRSTDNGASWAQSNSGLKAPELMDLETVGSTLFAASFGDGIYRSSDNGTSWQAVNNGLGDLNVYDVIASGSALLAGTNGGVYRSTDNGANWTLANTGLAYKVVEKFVTSDGVIFAAPYSSGIYRSTDNGVTWAPANNGPNLASQNVISLAVNGTSIVAGTWNSGIYRSTDNGDTWTLANNGLPASLNQVRALAVSGTTLFAGISYNGIYRSTDNGDSWTPVNNGLGCSFPRSFAMHGSTIFAGTNGGGVYRSTNAGDTWTSYSDGLTNVLVQQLTLVGNHLFAGGPGSPIAIRQNAVTSGCPTVIAVIPNPGGIGNKITLTGANFTGVSAVKFSNNLSATFTIINDTQIVTTVPAGAMDGVITLSKPSCGDVNTGSFDVVDCPTVSGFAPNSGAAGTPITITGANLTGVTSVKFSDNVSAAFTVNSDTQITATVPAGAVSGALTLGKFGCNGTQIASFTVPGTFACAMVSAVSPASANVGETVTITGANLTGVTSVKFSNNVSAAFTIVSDSQITAMVPAGAISGALTLGTPGCAGRQTAPVNIIGCPLVENIFPVSGAVGSTLTIAGSGLSGVSFVKFNNNTLSAVFSPGGDTSLYVTVPPGATSGPITLIKPFCPNVQTPQFDVVDMGGWAATGGPTGGQIFSLLEAGGVLYAGAFGGGVYRSINGGDNWTAASGGMGNVTPYTLAVIDTTLFAGTNGGVYRSSDGVNWTAVNNGLNDQVVFSLAVNGTTLFAGTNTGGVYRSTDLGVNWVQVSNGLGSGQVRSLVVSNTTLLALTSANQVYRSPDNGANWTAVTGGLQGLTILSLAANSTTLFAGSNISGIYRSFDGGLTWAQSNTGLVSLGISTLAANGAIIFTSTGNGVYRSTDNGATWAQQTSGLDITSGYIFAIGSVTVYAADFAGIHRLPKDSTTWTPINTGLTAQIVNAYAYIAPYLFAATQGGGVYRSADNGTTWTQTNSGLGDLFVNALITNGGTLFAGTNTGVYRSTDNGATWALASAGLEVGFSYRSIQSVAASGSALYAGTYAGGVYSSTNNGASWTAINNGLGNQNVYAVAASGATLFAGTNFPTGLYRSTDGGANWTQMRNDLGVNSLNFVGTDVYAGTTTGLYRSSDNGANWTQALGFEVKAMTFSNATLFIATPFGGIYRSTNNGAGWATFNDGLTNLNVRTLSLFGNNLFAGTQGSSTFVRLSGVNCPTISGLTPGSGIVGSAVTITGGNLAGVTGVKFNNNVSATITSNTDSQITVIVPSGAVTGQLTISKIGCFDAQTVSFTVTPPTGSYTVSASPSIINAGGSVTVSWTAPNGSSTTDRIGLYLAKTDKKSLLSAFSTNGATSGSQPVNLPKDGGQYEFRYLLNGGYNAVASSNAVTVVAGSCHSATAISPASAAVGANVTITGTNLTGVTAVKFSNNLSASFTIDSSTQITATVPAGAISGSITLIKAGCPDVVIKGFTVTPPSAGYTLTASPGNVNASGTVTVNWTAPAGSAVTDRIGLYRIGASNKSFVSVFNTNGATIGGQQVTMPAAAASYQYEFRYLLSNYTVTQTSNPVTVNAANFQVAPETSTRRKSPANKERK